MKATHLFAAPYAVFGVIGVSILLSLPVRAEAADATQLLTKYGCQACHTADKKLVGPSYKEVAAKYAGDATAAAKLEQKIKTGGSGVWGAIPMPPNNVPPADLRTIVASVLATK